MDMGLSMIRKQLPPLVEGEIYGGAIGDLKGDVHHVILLPGDNDDATWQVQMDWAKSIGGDLPTRAEQALLWAYCRDQFQKDWYWSNEVYERDSGFAWLQYFYGGYQVTLNTIAELRARAVRRLPL